MATFTYTGTDKGGKTVTETVQADDRYAVYDIARDNDHAVVSVEEAAAGLKSYFNVEKLEYMISRIKADELVLVTRNLSSMLKAGLPLSRALSVIERQSKNPRLKGVINQIQKRITKGDQFHVALQEFPKVFSDLYVSMVRAGEEGGKVSEALSTLSLQMERSSSLRKKIKGAMMYPAIVIVVMIIIGILMMIFVVPSITSTFESLEVDLPTTTQILIGSSKFMSNNAVLTIGLMVGGIVGFMRALKSRRGKRIFNWIIIRLPVIGPMVKEANSAQMARTLSSLLKSGVDVILALKITEDVIQNVYFKAVLAEAAVRVEKGTPLSEPLIENDKLYPVFVGEMVAVGEETGQISDMLEEVAKFYEKEIEQKTKDLSTIIEPILMVVIGGTVGFFALAMIAPIYSISDSIG